MSGLVDEKVRAYEVAMDNLYTDWRKKRGHIDIEYGKKKYTFDVNHEDSFITDGIVCPEEWFKEDNKFRPLFLLKEAYDTNGKGFDLIKEQLATEDKLSGTWIYVTDWTWGLFNTTAKVIADYSKAPSCSGKKEGYDKYNNEMLRKIAVINCKKSGGKSKSKYEEILGYADFDREELKREIEICDPTIIICGYTATALEYILKSDEDLTRYNFREEQGRNPNLYYHIELNGHDVLVIDYYHPQNRYPAIMRFYGLVGLYQMALKSKC